MLYIETFKFVSSQRVDFELCQVINASLSSYIRPEVLCFVFRLQSLSLLKQLFSLVGWCHLPPSIASALADDKEVPPKVYGQVTAMSVSVTGLPESSAATADEVTYCSQKSRG